MPVAPSAHLKFPLFQKQSNCVIRILLNEKYKQLAAYTSKIKVSFSKLLLDPHTKLPVREQESSEKVFHPSVDFLRQHNSDNSEVF